jgi:hypothetical protein
MIIAAENPSSQNSFPFLSLEPYIGENISRDVKNRVQRVSVHEFPLFKCPFEYLK